MNKVEGATLGQEQGPRKLCVRAACAHRPLILAGTEDRIEVPAYKHGKFYVIAFLLHLTFRDDVFIGISLPADPWDCCE